MLARPPSARNATVLGTPLTQVSNASKQQRQRFGRALTLARIETALLAAFSGSMRDLTDLSRETIGFDPHLGGVLPKRLRPLGRWDWQLEPAQGPGVNEGRAQWYVDVVRGQLATFKSFPTFLHSIAWALWDGRGCNELVWREGNGETKSGYGQVTMAIRGWQWVHPRRLNVGLERQLVIADDSYGSAGGAFAPRGLDVRSIPYKFVVWTPQLFGDYVEREGLATPCMYWSFMKRFAARERMILTELFGKPWRIVEVMEDSQAGTEDLTDAENAADQLGSTFTARMPRGVKLVVVRPDPGDGKTHRDIMLDVDAQISKVLLGQTGTTDGVASGLNSNQSEVMSGEQGDLSLADAALLSEVIEDQLTDAIIAANFGPDEVVNAPVFRLVAKRAKDAVTESARLKGALDAGLSIKLEEAYEAVGFSMPSEEDAVVRMEQPAALPGSLAPPALRPIVVYRDDNPRRPGAMEPPPVFAPTGDKDVDEVTQDDSQTQVLNGAQLAVIMQLVIEVSSGVLPRESALALAEIALPGVSREMLERLIPEFGSQPTPEASETMSRSRHALDAREHARAEQRAYVSAAADHEQPDGPNGSVETLLARGQAEARRAVEGVIKHYQSAVAGKVTAIAIVNALYEARNSMDLRPLGRALERRMVHAAALGALDADDESELEVDAAASDSKPNFSTMPFDRALKSFLSRKPIPRAAFDKLSARAKQRAFTVAGVVSEDALATIQDELAKVIGSGGSLARFSERIGERMKEAGFLQSVGELADGSKALNASHVETVFRTNSLSAYNAGRAEQARQPAVMAKRPVWEIRGVKDDRTRHTHLGAQGKMLLATDPFWAKAYPPFGFGCRCRIITRGPEYLSQVVSGTEIEGLPDEGFSSGLGSLLAPDPFE